MEKLEEELVVGVKIKLGKNYAEKYGFVPEEVIELIEGYFEHDNGLYTETQTSPAIWDGEEFHSIYHLFGNKLEYWMDCEITRE